MHPQQPHFRLTRQAIMLGIIAAAYPMAGYCVAAGRTDFVIGHVEAVAPDGSRRALAKGSEISAGDAINTSAGARAQVRFIDGGYVSLQPNTQFRVDQFNFQNKTDGNEQGFFSLLKGGLRAITGAIGQVNRNTYKVATPSATIGIRGTGYKAEIRDDGLFVSVGEGAISLTNNVGLLVVTAGNAAFVANANTAPSPTTEQPQVPPANLEQITSPVAIIQPALPLPSLPSGSGYEMAYAFMNCSDGCYSAQIVALSGVTATFNSNSQLTAYSGGFTNLDSSSIGTASVTFSATDGTIGWGRWDGDIVSTSGPMSPGLTPGVFHYVIGLPTAAMPTSGTATYSLLGYTNPTADDLSTGWSVQGDLSASFGSTSGMLVVNMVVSNANNSYSINGNAPISTPTATFSGSAWNTTSTTGGCTSGCFTSVNGFFAGTDASRAGLSYQIDESMGRSVQGAAAFSRTTPPPLN